MKKNENKSSRENIYHAFSLFTQLGISMSACIFTGFIIGKYSDALLGTYPLFVLIFSVIGAMSAFKTMYDMTLKKDAKRSIRRADKK